MTAEPPHQPPHQPPPQVQYVPVQYVPVYAVKPPINTLSVIGLVAGILGMLLFILPIIGLLISVTAVVCGHVGRRQIGQEHAEGRAAGGRGMAIAAIALGWVATGLAAFMTIGMIMVRVF
ncbi:DUF4190 domain-containing protein [Puerhibacterium puerhi]|uniref:DUF4190 domain-containing protein n=1 Tax=Puerhibacterium puerhi TaxID=2692623 RepID=UPI00135A2617|nr:DUF4190 domain-containing protein [Puerhibacterium puerhi]